MKMYHRDDGQFRAKRQTERFEHASGPKVSSMMTSLSHTALENARRFIEQAFDDPRDLNELPLVKGIAY